MCLDRGNTAGIRSKIRQLLTRVSNFWHFGGDTDRSSVVSGNLSQSDCSMHCTLLHAVDCIRFRLGLKEEMQVLLTASISAPQALHRSRRGRLQASRAWLKTLCWTFGSRILAFSLDISSSSVASLQGLENRQVNLTSRFQPLGEHCVSVPPLTRCFSAHFLVVLATSLFLRSLPLRRS